MEKPKEPTTETKAKSNGSLRLIIKRRIIKLKFLQGITKIAVFGTVCRIKSAVNHRIYLLISRKCLRTGVVCVRYGITHTGIPHILDTGSNIADHTCRQFITGNKLASAKISYFYDFRSKSGSHHMNLRALFYTAVLDPAKYDNTFIRIINRVKDKGFQRCIHISLRCRNFIYNLLQNLFHVQTCLCGNLRCILGFNPDHILNLIDNTLRVRTWKVDLIDNRNHIQIMIQRHIYVGKGLSLDSLGSIYNKDRAVTGCKTPGNFIIKVYMSRGIDQVKNIFISILGLVYNTDSLGFDGDSTFSLQFHIIQNLGLHFSLREKSCHLDDTVRKC